MVSNIDEINLIGGFYSNAAIGELKKDNNKDYNSIYGFVAALLLEYTIAEEKLKLTTAQRILEFKKASVLINDIFSNQTKNEIKMVTDILKDTINKLIKFRKKTNQWNISNKDVRNILNTEIDGKTYSDRIYDNKNAIAKLLKKQTKDLLDGKTSVNEIKDLIKKTFGTNDHVTDRLVENEISRVCRELDERYFIDNDIIDLVYCGILDSHICEKCLDLDGKEFKRDDPNRPKLPKHIRCRCFYSIADKSKKSLNMSSNKSDDKNPVQGNKISNEQLNNFIQKLNDLGVNCVGFEEYHGEYDVLNNMVEDLKVIINDFPMIKNLKNGLTLKYEDAGNVEDLAVTRGKTIILNKRVFDDSEYMKQMYDKLTNEGWFVKGTDYRSVIYHEIGHILNNKDKRLLKSVENDIRKRALDNNMKFNTYVMENISEYASITYNGYNYEELLPELISMCYNGNNKKIAEEIINQLKLR
ncbi:minor capsid protein [Clostridium beijerinckii]|uniref:minor capsid protein n=1 Tax=Clostridium beijerinckii TaxID=1520 RepID=UPI00047A07E5|nr:minor capsid protein [Clostridium beijerinckii]